jgi:hypothetical protein
MRRDECESRPKVTGSGESDLVSLLDKICFERRFAPEFKSVRIKASPFFVPFQVGLGSLSIMDDKQIELRTTSSGTRSATSRKECKNSFLIKRLLYSH